MRRATDSGLQALAGCSASKGFIRRTTGTGFTLAGCIRQLDEFVNSLYISVFLKIRSCVRNRWKQRPSVEISTAPSCQQSLSATSCHKHFYQQLIFSLRVSVTTGSILQLMTDVEQPASVPSFGGFGKYLLHSLDCRLLEGCYC